MAKRRVVFVADDLGISAGVNEGIAAAAQAGIVREASLCVTGSAVEEGVRLAQQLGIGIGLHLSFTLGRSLSGPIRGLTDAQGRFGGLGRALLRCQLRQVDRGAVAREIEAQLVRLRELGVQATHANGHHHSHCWPVLRELCAEAFARHGIPWTRLPAEAPGIPGRLRPLTMVLGALLITKPGASLSAVVYPLALGGVSIIASIIGCYFVKAREGGKIMNALYRGLAVSGVLALIAFYFVTDMLMGGVAKEYAQYSTGNLFGCAVIGLVDRKSTRLNSSHSSVSRMPSSA